MSRFPWSGGGKHAGLWPVLQGRSLSHFSIGVGDVGPDDPECPDPWILPPQGGTSSDGAISMETSRKGVVIPTPRGGYAGGRARVY